MAAAGSGDVLTGITAAFLALDFKNRTAADSSEGSPLNPSEGSDLYPSEGSPFLSGTRSVLFTDAECSDGFAAAVAAVCLHGRAGDLAAVEYGKQGMTAGDIAAQMRKASFWQKK
jgi:NAD(P)H-hydrate epimerase